MARIFLKFSTTIINTSPADAMAATNSSLQSTPNDPEAHYTRGAVANQLEDSQVALAEFERAVSLRPRDYYLWIELGLARDNVGDQTGALSAYNEALRLAPFYAQPRWLRGNLLFRMGKYDEAFVDLRESVKSNPEYFPAFIDLAWGASRKDSKLTEQLIQPQTDQAHAALAEFYAKHNVGDQAIIHLRALGTINNELRKKIVRDLQDAGSLKYAFAVWSSNWDPDVSKPSIFDGGFEGTLNIDSTGFGWHLATQDPGISFSLDMGGAQSGQRSLRVTLTGHPSPNSELVTQTVLLEPSKHYKLHCFAKTSNVVTGGPFVIVVKDAKTNQLLGKSNETPTGTQPWQPFTAAFETGPATTAIRFVLQREECSSSPCPAFGTINLDSFSIVVNDAVNAKSASAAK